MVNSATGNIFADAAVLARGAYSDTPASAALGWQPLGAGDLGIPAFGAFGAGSYLLSNGIYTGTDSTNSAVAHVYVGELRGETTLALAFRGTDEVPGDLRDHLHFTDHYAQFQPLIAALQNYADDPIHGVDKVLVTGHSLGSAMVTTAMVEEGWLNDPKYLGVAIASHGTDASLAATAPAEVLNLVNFIHTQDFLVLAREDGLPGSTIGDLAGAAPFGGDGADFEPKTRIGTDVWIETGNAVDLISSAVSGSFEDPVTAEHRIGIYEADITKLAQHQELQPASILGSGEPHYFGVGTDEVDNFAQDQFVGSASRNEELWPTKDFDQRIYTEAGDDAIAGSGGNDLIDGGPGNDTALYRGAAAEYMVTAEDGATRVVHSSAGAGSDGIDTLFNVETLHFADGDRDPDGAPVAPAGTSDDMPITFDDLIDEPSVTLLAIRDEISDQLDQLFG
jgi:hypothetical protein